MNILNYTGEIIRICSPIEYFEKDVNYGWHICRNYRFVIAEFNVNGHARVDIKYIPAPFLLQNGIRIEMVKKEIEVIGLPDYRYDSNVLYIVNKDVKDALLDRSDLLVPFDFEYSPETKEVIGYRNLLY